MSGSTIIANQTETHRHTLRRTDCCSALLSLAVKVKKMEREGQWINWEGVLREKALCISHMPISNVCHSCRALFINLSNLASTPLGSAEDLTPTLDYNF